MRWAVASSKETGNGRIRLVMTPRQTGARQTGRSDVPPVFVKTGEVAASPEVPQRQKRPGPEVQVLDSDG